MEAGIARIGRIGLALLTALALILSVVLVLAGPALGQEGNPPSVECASDDWNGEYWKIQVNNGSLGSVETNVPGAITLNPNGSWVNNHDNEVFRIVLKTGTPFPDFVHEPPVNPIDLTVQGLSHVTFCFTDEVPETTTTTTVPEETTTTLPEETTTTLPEETTTTLPEETTTTLPEETTTTTIEDEVLGEEVTTTQPEETTTTVEDEVLSEELPFTGIENEGLALVAAALTTLGLLVTLSARRIEE